jgi:hypothetical protein
MVEPKTGIAVGLAKGHVVTKREQAPRPANRKGVRSFFFVLVGRKNREAAAAAAGVGWPDPELRRAGHYPGLRRRRVGVPPRSAACAARVRVSGPARGWRRRNCLL